MIFAFFYFYKSSGILVLLVLLVFWFSRGFFDFCIFYICKTSIILLFLRTNNTYLYICIYNTPFAHEKGRLLGGGDTIYIYIRLYK